MHRILSDIETIADESQNVTTQSNHADGVPPIVEPILDGTAVHTHDASGDFKSLTLTRPLLISATSGDSLVCGAEITQDSNLQHVYLQDSNNGSIKLSGGVDAGLLVMYLYELAGRPADELFTVTVYRNPSVYVSDALDIVDHSFALHIVRRVKSFETIELIAAYVDAITRNGSCEDSCWCERWGFCKNDRVGGRSCNALKSRCYGCCGA